MTTSPAKLLSKQSKAPPPPRKPCENAPTCRENLSGRSKFTKCEKCRRADKIWGPDGDKRPSDILERHYQLQVWDCRLIPHLPERVTSINTARHKRRA